MGRWCSVRTVNCCNRRFGNQLKDTSSVVLLNRVMSDKEQLESWQIEKALNELVEEWKPATGEGALERADLVIKKLKRIPKPCEDCGFIIEERLITLNASQNPYPHWKECCKQCNLWRNPDTNKFEFTYNQLSNYYNLKKRKKK